VLFAAIAAFLQSLLQTRGASLPEKPGQKNSYRRDVTPRIARRIPRLGAPSEAEYKEGNEHNINTVSANSAHTRSMTEDRLPICDRRHFRMWPEGSSFLPTVIFNCASPSCRRYYGKRHGYLDLLPAILLSIEQIDPDNRSMKLCPTKGENRLVYGNYQT